jgi:hypothetical protein
MDDSARLDALRRLYAAEPRRYFAPLASAMRRSGDARAAASLVREHLADQPEHLTGHVILGQALSDLGDAPGAQAAFARAHAVDDGNVVALGALVRLARAAGDERAAAHWTTLLHDADPSPGVDVSSGPEVPTDAAEPAEDEPGSPDQAVPAGAFELLEFDEGAAFVTESVPATAADAPDPIVGLDEAPDDPLPEPMRDALPTLLDTPALDAPPTAAPFVTETMAGLLAAQGHTAQALDVYVQLLAQRPGDARLRARVEALRAGQLRGDEGGEERADAAAAAMWRAAFAPVPAASPADASPDASLGAPAVGSDSEGLAPDELAGDGLAPDAPLDDLSFDRFFEAFGDDLEPAPAEPAGDFERWASELDTRSVAATPDPPPDGLAATADRLETVDPPADPPTLDPPAADDPAAFDPSTDDPEHDLAEFQAWLRGVGA